MNIENSKRSWKFSKPETLEFKAKKYGTIGVQNGLFIENDKGIDGIIRKVSFYICKEGFPNTPFRIRIYNLNKENNCPGEDLLTHSVIVSNGNEAGWFTIDLSNYQIDFPIDGAFIMMEWINAGEQYNYTEDLRMGSKDLKTERIEHWNLMINIDVDFQVK